jgi:anti-sigma B factor antagonist
VLPDPGAYIHPLPGTGSGATLTPGGPVTPHGSTEVEVISAETSIVTLHGEHDLASAAQLAVALAVAAGCPNILVDMSDSDFIDSSVISAFLRAAGKARQRDGALELVVPEGGIARRALDLAGVPPLLRFHETRVAAIASAEARAEQRAGRSGLRAITAKIEDLEAKTEAERAQFAASEAGVTVIRARIADPVADTEIVRHLDGPPVDSGTDGDELAA